MADDVRSALGSVLGRVAAQLEAELELGTGGVEVPLPPSAPQVTPGGGSSQAPPGGHTEQDQGGEDVAALRALAPSKGTRLDAEERRRRLKLLAEQAADCAACVLRERRNRNVFARGTPDAELVFVGEGPGRDEDRQGLPFVGAAGQLLDRMIAAMGYGRDDVYICNIVKCRPPENRTPRPEEALACARFLEPQLQIVAPKMIVALGRCAAQNLGVAGPSGPWRGRFQQWQGIPVMPTYHPAFLLRSPEFKRTVWADLQQVMARLGKPIPGRGE